MAGGGTGGHLFPGIAIAQEFMSRNPENRIVFISTGNAMEKSVLSQAGFELLTIPASGLKGLGVKNQVRSLFDLPKGILAAVRHLKKFKPDLVISVGSYSAGPVAVAAFFLGVNIALHEQNILPGITNRILSPFAKRIYLSFDKPSTGMKPKKIRFSGNPVRSSFFSPKYENEGLKNIGNGEKIPFTILIVGGSQGAHSINQTVIEALAYLDNKDRFLFVHQTGRTDKDMVKGAYERIGVACEVRPFFNDMEKQYQKADLLICRSGATTVAEITVTGKASILIPFPYAADNHQVLNAEALDEAGAAEMILERHLNGRLLARRIEHYARNPKILVDMENVSKKLGRPDAAGFIVNDCYQLMGEAV